ncbi:hypothetical protein V496_10241, partial [Pseudogymnoascus sp. VKM F-4515 (FW-2607)]
MLPPTVGLFHNTHYLLPGPGVEVDYPHYLIERGSVGGDGECFLEVGDQRDEDIGVCFSVYHLLLPALGRKRQLRLIPMGRPKQLLRDDSKPLIPVFPQLGGVGVRDERGVETVRRDDAAVDLVVFKRRCGASFIREERCVGEGSAEMGEGTGG